MTEATKAADKSAAKPDKKNGDSKPVKTVEGTATAKKDTETTASTTTTEDREDGKIVNETLKSPETEIVTIETDGHGAFVQVEVGMTLNVGNLEFTKIGITRRAPCKVGEEAANAAVKVVKAWCRRELRTECEGVRAKVKAAADARKASREKGRGKSDK
jgi:hypothetical protein